MSDTGSPNKKKKEGDKAPNPDSGRQKKLAAARAARKESKEAPSSNWAALKKKLPADARRGPSAKKRPKQGIGALASAAIAETETAPPTSSVPSNTGVKLLPPPNDSPLLQELRQMVLGHEVLTEAKKAYVAPRERVTDYRTWVSGIRESDLRGAPLFDEVQKKVAELVQGRVLVGHAIENDTKALLLSHPAPFVRDTQRYRPLREAARSKRPGLKSLVESQLGLKIQSGAHSSITDARATMGLYRLNKDAWEASLRGVMEAYVKKTGSAMPGRKKKRKRDDDEEAGGNKSFPGGGQKGISSGLSVVVKRFGKKIDNQPKRRGPAPAASAGGSWWEEAAG
ncbi:hypothetical protein CcaverHIS641_0703930 [Cutaneotrichosporon cavernicola]|nr:hypothetical protein CcaverHIS641_0703930 [Cutaneotrichosporon cavernicola]